jgi:hypothetical protein
MKSVKTLIDSAAAKCGSDAELARRVGAVLSTTVPRNHVADWRAGRRPISPETVIALCDVLDLPGEECQEWVAISIVENPKNASRVEVLKRALFACWALGVVSPVMPSIDALGTVRNAATATAATEPVTGQKLTEERLSLLVGTLALMARWLRRIPASFGARGLPHQSSVIAAAG